MPTNEGFSGVSNCYVFKSRLQEYAQKVGLPTPVYETIKEGPSHEPCFRSTVIVNDVRYDSLPGFYNRKAAEQSAAEVALLELLKNGEVNHRISQPVHETGLCKNLLQEYAQKMNYAIPLYHCQKDEASGKVHFKCTVEIGGIRYIGAAAKTKKEAEIKAARTALLAIQELSGKSVGNSQLTVIPCRKRGAAEMANNAEETVKVPKAKKCRFKKMLKKKRSGGRGEHTQVQGTGNLVNIHTDHKGSKIDQTNISGFQLVCTELLATEAIMNCQEGRSDNEPIRREVPVMNDALSHCFGGETGDSESVHSTAANCNHSSIEPADIDTFSVPFGFTTALAKKVNDATPGAGASSVSYEPTTALARESNEATPDAGASSVSYDPTTALARVLNEATPDAGASSVFYEPTTALARVSNEATPDAGASYVSYEPTTALAKEPNEAIPDVGTSSVSFEPTTAPAKEVNKVTGVMEAALMMNSSTTALAKELNSVTPDVCTFSTSYEPMTPLATDVNKTIGALEASSMMNTSTAALVESNEVTSDVVTYSKSYEPTIALATDVNGPLAVMEATSPMNNSILGQVESSSCVIPGVNQAEKRVQAGTNQA